MRKLNKGLFIALLFLSCNESVKEIKSRETFIGEIKTMERAEWLYGNPEPAEIAWRLDSLNRHYERFIEAFPGDVMVSRFMFKRATNFQTAQKFDSSVLEFQRLLKQFPNSPLAPDALLLQGHVYIDGLNQWGKGVACWETYLTKYPDSPQCAEIKTLMKNKGLSNERLLNEVRRNAPNP